MAVVIALQVQPALDDVIGCQSNRKAIKMYPSSKATRINIIWHLIMGLRKGYT